MSKVTPEMIASLTNKLKETKEDDTPVAVINPENQEITVIGDANLTEKEVSGIFDIKFRLPKDLFEQLFPEEKPDGTVEYTSCYTFTVTYENPGINPRNDAKLVRYNSIFMSFFLEFKEDGVVNEKDALTIMDALIDRDDYNEIMIAMYNVVATFLNIDSVLGSWMTSTSVFNAIEKMMKLFPEVYNETNFF